MTQPPQYPGTPEPPEEPDGTTPPPLPPEAAPQPPAYGAPQQPPAYGAPQQPWGAPQQPYGGGYPAGPASNEPSKALAITALVLSFLACTFVAGIVSLVLAIVVLVRGRDGRNHGKGLAIAAIVVNILVMGATVVGIVAIADFAEEQSIANLETGECFNADDLTDDSVDRIGLIDKVDCDGTHDGQVVGTAELSGAQAEAYPVEGFDCTRVIEPDLLALLDPEVHLVFGLTEEADPEAGDSVACILTNADGSRLTEKIG